MCRSIPTVALLALAACTGSSDDDSGDPCAPGPLAVVTDIDETLTTSDSEWTGVLVGTVDDEEMRPEANALMQDYDGLGYRIFYVTARGEGMATFDGTLARDHTVSWLEGHGFPLEPESLFLAEGDGASGQEAVDYKSAVIDALEADGWTFAEAYGNAESDIEAYRAAGIADDRIWLVGELAGTIDGVGEIPDGEAFAVHRSARMPTVPAVCE